MNVSSTEEMRYLPPELRCISHQAPLLLESDDTGSARLLACTQGCRVPFVNGVPRFVPAHNYAAGFGLQWKAFRKTQLDSYTGTTVSRDRLARCLGAALDVLSGKTVLEVGCGAGRFTELMLAAGARVCACDLSNAVEANYENCCQSPNYFVCQADVRQLPLARKSFDFVVCLGVIQHTPNPEETITALAQYVKPGGSLVIDHYGYDYPMTGPRRVVRQLLLHLPPRTAKAVALAIGRLLLPLHKLGWNDKRGRWRLRKLLTRISPVLDYYETYPQLSRKLLAEWSLLDTHDTLTDYYKHLRSVEEIRECLAACGFVNLEVYHGGNGVEARARAPLSSDRRKCA
jgi:2-polyprenyl-3-methyl-5-hydroxy-6-metoxy-1,4-benzoquinol methylase